MTRIERLIRQAERLKERERRLRERARYTVPRSRKARVAELRMVLQKEHPDKGGDRVKFERAMLELDKLRNRRGKK